MSKVTEARHSAVVGLQFGDEGKGQLVDRLSADHDLIVRYNGGANAGHTVRIGEERFALHLLPSGVLAPHTLNVIGNGVVVDPAVLLSEIDTLAERGIALDGNLRLSACAHVVFPYHQREDGLQEAAMRKLRNEDAAIGTTGRGIGPAYADKALRATAVRVGDLLEPERLRERLGPIVAIHNAKLGALAGLVGEPFEPYDAAALADTYLAYGERLRQYVCNSVALLHGAMADGRRILFEGANAVLLDVDHGTYPFVTSSSASALGIAVGSGVPAARVGQIHGVVKAYTSRVGAGPFPTELFDDTAERIRERGNEYGTTTGRPRRCGWLDLAAVRYAARLCGVTDLVLTGLSVLTGLDHLRVCTGYRLNGVTLTEYPSDAAVLAEVEPVFEELEGYGEELGEYQRFGELPAAAQRYVELIEQHVAPVGLVCVGRRRDQVIPRR